MDSRQELEQLAALYGVETGYHDIRGRLRVATTEALTTLLQCLGAPIREGAPLGPLVRARQVELAERLIAPVSVVWGGTGAVLVRAAIRDVPRHADVHIELEGGASVECGVDLAEAKVVARLDVAGVPYGDFAVPLPGRLPYGYHHLLTTLGKRSAESALFVAPARAFAGDGAPGWGLFAPTYALRSARNAGIGDLADLGRLSRFVGSRGGSVVATLPLLPTFIDGPYDPSPYAPVSRLFWNELHLAIDQLPELESASRARAVWSDTKYRETAEELRWTPSVEYEGVVTHKRRVLAELGEAAFSDPATRRTLEAYLAEHPECAEYARFRAVVERQRRPFRQWLDRVREHPSDGDFDAASFRYHAYCQIRASEQMAALARESRDAGVGLYMDLPLGAHSEGYDAFRFGSELLPDCATGAPPDALFEGGQNWGFSPPHPERSRAHGHRYFVACLRHQMRHASVLRIDHVMGLHRLFCIPRGFGAGEGMYVRHPSEELYAAVCIESHRSSTSVVGEDLGTVPDEVRATMAERGLGRLFVLQYEPPPEQGKALSIPANAVASLNTHDMPTFAGYYRGRDIEIRKELALVDDAGAERELLARARERSRLTEWLAAAGHLEAPASDEELLGAELRCIGQSDARFALASLDDLLGETEPQNVPGTGVERPNWRRKLRSTLEEIEGSPEVHRLLSSLRRVREGSVRPPPPAVRSRPSTRLSDLDLHLFNEGTHRQIYDELGAHPGELDGERGTFFAVWAPNADSVQVVGDFNEWASGDSPLFPRGGSGVWEGFVPGVSPGDLYKLRIVSKSGTATEKADPLAFRAETPPRTASIVWKPEHDWADGEWMATRAERSALDAPCSIYEVHLGSFRRAPDGALLSYREMAPLLADHVRNLGFTHVELMPVMEHPFYASWGYQITGYFAATSRYGPPEDLMFLVDTLHQAGIGVIFDWVPGHFPTDGHGLGAFDGTHLYEHADPRRGFHPDWKSHIFNYGRHEVRSFLTSSALYWLDRFHGDGLRVDGVASMLYLDYSRAHGEWIPNAFGGRENIEAIEFLRWLNESAYGRFPAVHITAEESTAWPLVSRPTYIGGLGFGAKWDLGWMHDTLDYFSRDPIHRRYHHHRLTFRGIYAWHENFVLPLSHDEVVHGKGSLLAKMPGDEWHKLANLRLLFAYQYATPGHKLLFMGSELGPGTEWNHDAPLDLRLLDSPGHAGLSRLVADLNRLYRRERALHELDQRPEGFAWVDVDNAEESVLAFERRARDGSRVVAAFNFTPVARRGYRIGVESEGTWHEVLNTNAAEYGGTGEGNFGGRRADRVAAQGRPLSLALTLPPLAAVFFRSPG